MEGALEILIVEDEYLTSKSISDSLLEVGYNIAGKAKSAQESLALLEEKSVDFVILDINIQGNKNGIWLAKEIREKYQLPFIFLTAYSDTDTITASIAEKPNGYLIKPFSVSDLFAAIEVAMNNFEQYRPTEAKGIFEDSNSNIKSTLIDDEFFVKEQHLYSKIKLRNIQFVMAELKYVKVKTHKKSYVLRYSFKEFIGILPPDYFIQVHRSYVVNKSSIEHIGPNFLMISGTEIPISTKRKDSVYKAFKFM